MNVITFPKRCTVRGNYHYRPASGAYILPLYYIDVARIHTKQTIVLTSIATVMRANDRVYKEPHLRPLALWSFY